MSELPPLVLKSNVPGKKSVYKTHLLQSLSKVQFVNPDTDEINNRFYNRITTSFSSSRLNN
ncbi:hypothetical protein Hanom_Chr06g00523691 [Helianthus anomalus]